MSTIANKERNRCAKVVRRYRDELIRASVRKPDARNMTDVLKVIHRLEEIESEIRNVPREYLPDIHKEPIIDGFSMDELDKAYSIIAEINHNPFEDDNV